MKKLLIVIFLSVLIYGCNKDDNPVSSGQTNQGTNWSLIFSKADSISFPNLIQSLGYVKGTTNNKFWIKYNYKADAGFQFNLKVKSGSYIFQDNESVYSANSWLNNNDSINYTYPIEDTVYYYAVPSNSHYVSLKNIEIYIK